MSTFISIHAATKLAASTVQSEGEGCSAHFTLNFEGDSFHNRGAVTIYTGDFVLSARLIEAINSTIAARKAELALAEQQEAAA